MHKCIVMGTPAQLCSYIRWRFKSATQPGFDWAFSCLQLFVSPPLSKGLSADEYPQPKSRIDHAPINRPAHHRSRRVARTC